MNKILVPILVALTLATPLAALAQQTNPSVTRAQVRGELVQLEHAGYHPARVTHDYPSDIQAAMTKVRSASVVTHDADNPDHRYGNNEVAQADTSTAAQR